MTVILGVCQLLGVLTSSITSDKFGRRWLTLSLFGAGAISVLCIGILGSFDYQSEDLGSVLVSLPLTLLLYPPIFVKLRPLLLGILWMRIQLRCHRRCRDRILIRRRNSQPEAPRPHCLNCPHGLLLSWLDIQLYGATHAARLERPGRILVREFLRDTYIDHDITPSSLTKSFLLSASESRVPSRA